MRSSFEIRLHSEVYPTAALEKSLRGKYVVAVIKACTTKPSVAQKPNRNCSQDSSDC